MAIKPILPASMFVPTQDRPVAHLRADTVGGVDDDIVGAAAGNDDGFLVWVGKPKLELEARLGR